MRVVSSYLLSVFFCMGCFAQTKNSSSLFGTSFVKSNEVLLRWAPDNYDLFIAGSKYGYKIERIETNSEIIDSALISKGNSQILEASLKSYSKNDSVKWNELFDLGLDAEIVHDVMYEPIRLTGDPKKDVESKNFAYGFALITCDEYADVSKAAGLFYSDKNASSSKKYIYKISLVGNPQIKCKPAYIFVDAGKLSVDPPNETLHAKRGVKRITLFWNAKDFRKNYTAYIIERSEDSVNFKRVNKTPFLPVITNNDLPEQEASFRDSIKLNQKYFYRIKGINPFGEFGPASNCISLVSKKYFSEPIIDSSKQNNKQIDLYWQVPQEIEPSYVKGFIIKRAKKAETNYEIITTDLLPANTRSFKDEKPNTSNYYKIGAISIDNDTAYSFDAMVSIVDETPPTSPIGLQATVDSTGIVKLQWNKNSENDLRGYRVFRTNALHEEFYERTRIILKENYFSDTIKLQTLTPQVYYSVSAVDSNYNNSPFSVPLRLKRPDKIKPVAPIITSLTQNDSAVILQWIASSSTDIMNHSLMRSVNNSAFEKIKQWSTPSDQTFVDTAIVYGNIYSYFISASDSSNNASSSSTRGLKFEPGVRKAVAAFSGKLDPSTHSIILSWNNNYMDIESFVIYKSLKNEPLRTYRSIPGTENSFKDETIKPSNTYTYRIKAVFKNGSESTLSKLMEISY